MDSGFLVTTHSLLRYAILITVAYAGFTHLVGRLRDRPILNEHRLAAIFGMALAHLQLIIGLILYFMGSWYKADSSTMTGRFMRFEHIGMMVLAIVLITLGRSLSKRSHDPSVKQMRIAIFYLIALALILVASPWPFTEIGKALHKQWL